MLQFWSVVPLNGQAFVYKGNVQATGPASAPPLDEPEDELDDVPEDEPPPSELEPLEDPELLLDDLAPLLDPLPLPLPPLLDVEPLLDAAASTPEPESLGPPLLSLLHAAAAPMAAITPVRTNTRRALMTRPFPSREASSSLRGASRRRRSGRTKRQLNV